jgi:hypothetical protein
LSTLITNYVITPDEARNLMTQEWAEIDYDGLTDAQRDVLDRINLAKVGQGAYSEANDPTPDEPGRPGGSRQERSNSETVPE